MSGKIKEISDATFDSEVLGAKRPVLVEFWAPWCGPCHMMAPQVERLAETYAGKLDVVKLNIDENPQTSSRYGVMSIPTVLLFSSDAPPRAAVGFRSAEQLALALDL